MNGELKIRTDFIPGKDGHSLVISTEFKNHTFKDEFSVLDMDFLNNLEDLYGADRLFFSNMDENEKHQVETVIIRLVKALAFFSGYSNRFPFLTQKCLTKFEVKPQFASYTENDIVLFETEIMRALNEKTLYIDL